ncbi:hypothetical protein PC129_g21145 [Phytophthora cactorum]|uniref:BZIP domain-containing protein n=1 Tax=Phytophthora cactorum TaxID=29920 RepID=A0A8T1H6W4_9STRA|nr:hypothetical protein Pcac1_g11827 [Phytophthora cactorum]KAG3080936.1 hypothetical protein PC122_g11535 [Phytophthora cactorum]KAG3207818.1 hypothetical protein PC129_g21145 [Phytophthora cactorum]
MTRSGKEELILLSDKKRKHDQDEGINTNAVPTIKSTEFDDSLEEWQRLSMQRRLKNRRENQRRYRKKQDEITTNLERHIQQLRDEIKKLQQHVRRFSTVNRDVWNVALEYYVRFRRLNTQDACSQLEFLRATMASDVVLSGGFGPYELVKSWSVLRWLMTS